MLARIAIALVIVSLLVACAQIISTRDAANEYVAQVTQILQDRDRAVQVIQDQLESSTRIESESDPIALYNAALLLHQTSIGVRALNSPARFANVHSDLIEMAQNDENFSNYLLENYSDAESNTSVAQAMRAFDVFDQANQAEQTAKDLLKELGVSLE